MNTNNTSTGTSAWAGYGMSPIFQHQGSGLPMAGYAVAASADLAVVPTAVRTADAKVPDPRGRKR